MVSIVSRTTRRIAVVRSLVPLVILLWPMAAAAQPSNVPAAPKYDTVTPVYDASDAKTKAASTIMAEVDGRAITLGDVSDAIRQLPRGVAQRSFSDLYPGVLDQLIQQQSLVLLAQRKGLDDDPEIKRRVKSAADRTLGQELLKREGEARITETMLLDRYKTSIASQLGPEAVQISVILTPTEQEALGLLQELKSGADFAAVARRASRDSTAGAGGELGFMQRDGLNAEIGAVAFALSPGQTAGFPVRSGKGWFIIKVTARRRNPVPLYPTIRDALFRQMVAELSPQILKEAMASSTFRINVISGKQYEVPDESANGAKKP